MTSFMEDLWTSIFTPGPTSALLVATNATFAALQAVLLALLFATYSVHFVVLSILCGGLWASINWFAAEIRRGNEEAEKASKKEKEESKKRGIATSDESGTETEEDTARKGVGARLTTGREGQEDAAKRRSFGDVEGSTDSEWDKLESEVDA